MGIEVRPQLCRRDYEVLGMTVPDWLMFKICPKNNILHHIFVIVLFCPLINQTIRKNMVQSKRT
jgi:hypothetical protein